MLDWCLPFVPVASVVFMIRKNIMQERTTPHLARHPPELKACLQEKLTLPQIQKQGRRLSDLSFSQLSVVLFSTDKVVKKIQQSTDSRRRWHAAADSVCFQSELFHNFWKRGKWSGKSSLLFIRTTSQVSALRCPLLLQRSSAVNELQVGNKSLFVRFGVLFFFFFHSFLWDVNGKVLNWLTDSQSSLSGMEIFLI